MCRKSYSLMKCWDQSQVSLLFNSFFAVICDEHSWFKFDTSWYFVIFAGWYFLILEPAFCSLIFTWYLLGPKYVCVELKSWKSLQEQLGSFQLRFPGIPIAKGHVADSGDSTGDGTGMGSWQKPIKFDPLESQSSFWGQKLVKKDRSGEERWNYNFMSFFIFDNIKTEMGMAIFGPKSLGCQSGTADLEPGWAIGGARFESSPQMYIQVWLTTKCCTDLDHQSTRWWWYIQIIYYIDILYIMYSIYIYSPYQLVRRMTCPSTVPFMNRRCLQPGLLRETLTSTLHCCWHWRFSCGCHEDRSRQCHASKRTSLRNLLDFDVTDKCAWLTFVLFCGTFFSNVLKRFTLVDLGVQVLGGGV